MCELPGEKMDEATQPKPAPAGAESREQAQEGITPAQATMIALAEVRKAMRAAGMIA